MRSIQIHVPVPTVDKPWLATNRRYHHQVRARLTRLWRERAQWEAKLAKVQPLETPCRVEAVIHWPDRHVRDVDGHMPSVKACVDGIVSAGIIPGDDFRHLPDWRVRADPASDTPGVTVILTEGLPRVPAPPIPADVGLWDPPHNPLDWPTVAWDDPDNRGFLDVNYSGALAVALTPGVTGWRVGPLTVPPLDEEPPTVAGVPLQPGDTLHIHPTETEEP